MVWNGALREGLGPSEWGGVIVMASREGTQKGGAQGFFRVNKAGEKIELSLF